MDDTISYEYVHEVNGSLECAICRNPFLNPAMSPTCQHIFCSLCITRALESSLTCPIDRSPLRMIDLVEAPRIVRQMVDELQVFCPECSFECERGSLRGHVRDDCPGRIGSIDLKGKGRETDEDVQREVASRCSLCHEKLLEAEAGTHLVSCSQVSILCSYCSIPLPRGLLSAHLLTCPLVSIPCPHASHGCTARLPRSLMLEDHLEVSCAYEPMKDFLDRYESRMGEVEGENSDLRMRCSRLEEEMRSIKALMQNFKLGMGEYWSSSTVEDLTSINRTDRSQSDPAILSSPVSSLDPYTYFDPTSPPATSVSLASPHVDFQPPLLQTSSPTSVSTPPLPATLSFLLTSVDTLSAEVHSQHDALVNETHHMQEDMQSIRGIAHGLRMQMHHLLMEVNRVGAAQGPSGVGFGMRMGMGMGMGGNGRNSSSSDGAESNSDDDGNEAQLGGLLRPPRYFGSVQEGMIPMGQPGMRMGMGMGNSPPMNVMYPLGMGGGMKL